jgi:hypothetical protein
MTLSRAALGAHRYLSPPAAMHLSHYPTHYLGGTERKQQHSPDESWTYPQFRDSDSLPGLPGLGLLIRRFRVQIPRGAPEHPVQSSLPLAVRCIGFPGVGIYPDTPLATSENHDPRDC